MKNPRRLASALRSPERNGGSRSRCHGPRSALPGLAARHPPSRLWSVATRGSTTRRPATSRCFPDVREAVLRAGDARGAHERRERRSLPMTFAMARGWVVPWAPRALSERLASRPDTTASCEHRSPLEAGAPAPGARFIEAARRAMPSRTRGSGSRRTGSHRRPVLAGAPPRLFSDLAAPRWCGIVRICKSPRPSTRPTTSPDDVRRAGGCRRRPASRGGSRSDPAASRVFQALR